MERQRGGSSLAFVRSFVCYVTTNLRLHIYRKVSKLVFLCGYTLYNMGRKALGNKIFTVLTMFMIFKNLFSVIRILPNFVNFLPWCNSPQWAKAYPLSRIQDHTQRRTTVCRTPTDE